MTIEKSALELVGDVYGLLEIDEFRPGLLAALRRAVPSDWVSLNEVGPDPTDTVAIAEPPLEHRWHKVWRAYAMENPLVVAYERTKDGRPYRFSDVISTEEFHALDLYREFYGPIGLEHQIAFLLPGASGAIIGVALSRRDRDYTDAERDLLELARPHLIQAYSNALRYSEALRAGRDGGGVRSIARARLERLREMGLTGARGGSPRPRRRRQLRSRDRRDPRPQPAHGRQAPPAQLREAADRGPRGGDRARRRPRSRAAPNYVVDYVSGGPGRPYDPREVRPNGEMLK